MSFDRNSKFLIAPSILSADFSKLGEEICAVEIAGADWIHVDVMDGHFVPNLTIGAPVVKSIRPITKLPLDVHLMIENPERYVADFAKAGADYLTVHIEATKDAKALIKQIRSLGVRPGITLRPKTPLSAIVDLLDLVDLVLVMTVEPGFGGQSFMEDQASKVTELALIRSQRNLNYLIEVDGGVSDVTAQKLKDADILVAGNFIFSKSYPDAIQKLKSIKR